MPKTIYKVVSFSEGEFEENFPKLASREDLNESDKVRVALKMPPRNRKAGAPKGNKNNPYGRRRNKEAI